MRARLRSDLVAAHAEAFLISGDMNSALYTSSRAMHSSVLGLLQVGLILVTFSESFSVTFSESF